MSVGLIAIAIAGLLVLIWRYRRDQMNTRRQRRAYFDDCLSLLDDPTLAYDAFGYPTLSGGYAGGELKAELIVDTLGVRKLPSLWLQVTLLSPVNVASRLGVIMRPLGSEFFSLTNTLDHRLETPNVWPDGAVVRCSEAADESGLRTIGAHAGYCNDPRGKEIFVSPRGVRLVWQHDEAERGDYLMLRQASFAKGPVRFHDLRVLAERCVSLRDMLNQQSTLQAGAA